MTKCIADDKKRLQEVAVHATEAFWRVVAEKYPEIKSGDVSPADVFEFDDFVLVVEVTLTTSDSATLEHMKAMFTQNALKAPKNALIKITRTQLSNGTKLTVTSTDANTIKLIQDKAASAKSGLFGNA